MCQIGRLTVLYGSQTFTAQEIAERIWRTTKALGFRGPVQAMNEYPISMLIHEEFAIFVCATTGQGDEPDNMKKFWKFLLRKNLPANSLIKLKFGVLGLGDSSYSEFNFVAKKLHKRLIQLGARPLIDVGLCDYQHDLGHDGVVSPWIKEYFVRLKEYFPSIQTDVKSEFIPRWKVSMLKDKADVKSGFCEDIYFGHENSNNQEALLLEVDSNVRTTDESHFQDVRLISFKSVGKCLTYKPGDVFNIRPRNSKEDIDDLFNILESNNIDIKPHYRLLVEEYHDDMPVPEFLRHPLTLYEVAEQYWDLRCYATQYVFSILALVSQDKLERDKCIELSSPEGQEDWLNYCRRTKRTVIEVLQDFHRSAAHLTLQTLFELFSIIKPRSFSIASACGAAAAGRGLQLLVAAVRYRTALRRPRLGLASNWLAALLPGHKVYGWIKKGTFVFPDDASVPYIMVGPGTGLAPFRSLLQERVHYGTASKDIMHLFFGCRYKEKDYHCREELEGMAGDGNLSLYCAFSRDQEDKIYVQHKIFENRETIWRLLNNNAHVFISGNAKSMPDNVREALADVIRVCSGTSAAASSDAVRSLQEQGRLQVETW